MFMKKFVLVMIGVVFGSVVTKKICARNEKKRYEELIENVPDICDQAFGEFVDKFTSLVKDSLSDSETSTQSSIELARMVGVPEGQIIKTKEDLDKFFLG